MHRKAHLTRKLIDAIFRKSERAVETDDINEIFKFHEGSDSCTVGKNMYQLMVLHMEETLNAMWNELQSMSIDALCYELQRMSVKRAE